MQLTPYEMGYSAFYAGDSIYHNPFERPNERHQWDRGYRIAEDDYDNDLDLLLAEYYSYD